MNTHKDALENFKDKLEILHQLCGREMDYGSKSDALQNGYILSKESLALIPVIEAGLQEWQDISSAPHNLVILVYYENANGKGRTVKARYITKFTEENWGGEGWCDYDEESDMYYDEEGWYEEIDNWPDYSHVAIHEGTPKYWQHLPTPPAKETV